MSPEQAQAKPIDHRSDIFSLGIVFYEVLTCRHPFDAGNTAAMLAAIIRDTPPPVDEVKSSLPRALGRIIMRCLSKDRTRRYQSALDLRNDLEELELDVSELVEPSPSASPARRLLPWAFAGIAAIVAAGVWFSSPGPAPAPPMRRFTIERPSAPVFPSTPLLSPDGRRLAYWNDPDVLQLRKLDQLTPTQLPIPRSSTVFFSPDGEWIGYRDSTQILKKVSLSAAHRLR